MINIFIDETGDNKYRDYFGITCVGINHIFYAKIKKDIQNTLKNANWDLNTEFKGSYIFSASRGCIEVDIDSRIKIVEKIFELTTSEKNSRMKLSFFRKKSDNHKKDYLEYLPLLVDETIKKYNPSQKQGKNLVSITCDNRDDVSVKELREIILPVVRNRKCQLFEDVMKIDSNCETVGLFFSDIIGYLMSRIETITSDSDLFINLTPEQIQKNGKLKKLMSSWYLIEKLRSMTIYGMNEK